MEILRAFFGKKRFVVNKKKRRVTAKFDSIVLYEHSKVVIAVCRDNSVFPIRKKIYFWDKETERALDYGNVEKYEKLDKDIFALRADDEWTIYGSDGYAIRGDVTYFTKCKNMSLYIARIGGKMYYVTPEFAILSGPYLTATDFDMYDYAVVQIEFEYYTLLNKDLKIVFEPIRCEQLKPLSEEFIRIEKNGKYGVINLEQKEIVPIVYDGIPWQRHNHFELIYNKKHGLANTNGKIVLECLYDEIMQTPDKFVVKDFAKIEFTNILKVNKQ